MANPRAFIAFDYDHDDFLRIALVGQSKHPDTDFAIADWSVKVPFVGDWKAKVRTRIKQTDQVIVICGEHTHKAINSMRIASQLLGMGFSNWKFRAPATAAYPNCFNIASSCRGSALRANTFRMKSTSLVPRASFTANLMACAPAMTKSSAAGPSAASNSSRYVRCGSGITLLSSAAQSYCSTNNRPA